MKRVPIKIAKEIAEKYGYNQVIIMAQNQLPNEFKGWITTYNKEKRKCSFLGKVAKILAYNFRTYYGNKKITDEHYAKMLILEKNNK